MSIEIRDLEHTYSPGSPFAHKALDGISLDIPEGQVTAIIGQTGSGKSTLVQHLNGLLMPQKGTIDIAGFHLEPGTKPKDIKQLRKMSDWSSSFLSISFLRKQSEKTLPSVRSTLGILRKMQ